MSLLERVKELYQRNLKMGISSDGTEFTYICPDIKRYPHQWLWDSCFHIIVTSQFDVSLAKKELESMLKFLQPNGFLPHMFYHTKPFSILDWLIKRYYKSKEISSITQAPFLAHAIDAIYKATDDKENLQEVIPKISAFFDWYYTERLLSKEIPLLFIIHSWESGTDNCPKYDKALGISGKRFFALRVFRNLFKQLKVLKKADWDIEAIKKRDYFVFCDLLTNCTYIEGAEILSQLFKELGNEEQSQKYIERAKTISQALIKYCWNENESFFFDVYSKNATQVDVKTITGLFPLIISDLPKHIEKALMEKYLTNEKEFWTDYPIPIVAISEESFSPTSIALLWRGPPWINMNWFLIRALKKKGYQDLCNQFSLKTIELVEKEGFREYYNPFTGEGMGAKNFGWSALVLDIQNNYLKK